MKPTAGPYNFIGSEQDTHKNMNSSVLRVIPLILERDVEFMHTQTHTHIYMHTVYRKVVVFYTAVPQQHTPTATDQMDLSDEKTPSNL